MANISPWNFQAVAINRGGEEGGKGEGGGRNEKAGKFDDTVSSVLPLKVS